MARSSVIHCDSASGSLGLGIVSNSLTYMERDMLSRGNFVCRSCGKTFLASERYRRHLKCKTCVMQRTNQRVRQDRKPLQLIKRLVRLRVDNKCLICGEEQHVDSCSVMRLIADLATLGYKETA